MADLGSIPALKAAIAARIFPNTTFEVSAKDIDDAFIDTIDTLKASLVAYNETNYGDLLTNITNGTLAPGAFYAFDYEHKYVVEVGVTGGSGVNGEIYNTDVTTIHEMGPSNVLFAHPYTAPSEKIIVQAVSTTQLAPQAMSAVHPTDVIVYDINDNRTEESGNTTQNRTGFIQYREDVVRSIKAEFDFRNSIGFFKKFNAHKVMTEQYNQEPVLQFNNQAPPAAFNPIVGWAQSAGSVTNITVGASIYMRTLGPLYNEGNQGNPGSLNYKNIDIKRADGLISYGSVYGIGRTPNIVISAVHAQNIKIGADCQRILLSGNTFYNVEIGDRTTDISVSNSPAQPTDAITAAPLSFASWQDVKIGGSVRNFFSAGGSNIEIGSNCYDICQTGSALRLKIKSNCGDISIIDGVVGMELEELCTDIVSWASSVKVGEGSSNMKFIHSGRGEDTLNVFGRNNDNIYVAHSFNMSVGDDNFNLRVQTQNECRIGNNNVNLYLQDGFNNIIGDGNETIELQSSQGHMVIGHQNTNLRLDASHTEIGNDNQDIYFVDPIVDSSVGNHNRSILAFQSDDLNIGNRNQNIFLQTCANVKVGDENNNITFESQQDVVIGSNNDRVTHAEHPLILVPSFSIPSSIRGIIYDHTNQSDFWSGTQYVNFTRLLNVSTNKAIELPYAQGSGNGLVIGSNCSSLLMAGGSDITIGDNVENFINCHDVDFAQVGNLLITLTVAINASDAVLTMTTPVAGLNPGTITVNLDEAAPSVTIVKVGANATATIGSFLTAALGSGGNDVTIDSNLSDVKLKAQCQGVRVQASTVDLTTISDVVVQKSWTKTTATGSHPDGAIIDLVSPDGSGWYATIADNGTVTRTKYE